MRISETVRRLERGAVGLMVMTVAFGASAVTPYSEATAADASGPLSINDQRFFSSVLQAISSDDKAWLSAHMTFPLYASFNGQHTVSAAEFAAHYHDIITLDVKDALIDQDSEKLFKNAQGVCAGEGCVLWFGYEFKNGKYKYRITTVNTPATVPVPPPPANGCNLQTVDWKKQTYPASSGLDAFQLKNGAFVERFDPSHTITFRFINVTYGDIEGKGGQQAFVRIEADARGETLSGGAAAYVFEADAHCAPHFVGSVPSSGDPRQRPGKLVNGGFVDYSGTRWLLVNHQLKSMPAPAAQVAPAAGSKAR